MGGAKFCRFALFPLMLLMLLLLPANMVAETDYEEFVTLEELKGNPEGNDNESYVNLFDGNNSKWCCEFNSEEGAYVIFKASKAGVPVGYTITTGNDNEFWGGRNPLSWKLYGNNEGKNGAWVLIDKVENDEVLKDKNNTPYNFTCECSTSYQYFKWEITAIHSGTTLQVGEFELKLNTCSHKHTTDDSSALGEAINTVEATCTEHGYTTHECSICHLTVKAYKDDELKEHTLTHHEAKDGVVKEHWQCDVCHKYFSDANATQEVTYPSLFSQAYVVFEESTETLTFRYDTSKPEGAYDLNVGNNKPDWYSRNDKIKKVVFDASFANARPTSCYSWFGECLNLTHIEGMENLNTEMVTTMEGMFYQCIILTSLDVTNFNTANVTNMSSMFQYCSLSSSLDLTSFNTANVTDMSSMFKYSDITSLDLTSFNTANVTDMSSMFEHCRLLKSIFVSDKFVTNQITNGDNMFNDCTNLRGYNDGKIDHNYANCSKTGYFDPGFGYAMFDYATETLTFSYKGGKPEGAYALNAGRVMPEWYSRNDKIKKVIFDASFANARPTSCFWWFGECLNLTRIEGMENLNTEMVTTMEGMFYKCEALTSLDVTNFNTANVTDMYLMFSSCTKLTSLNLYNFNTENVTNMLGMFSDCNALATIYASDKFVTTKVENLNYLMFDGDENLKGANVYDEMKTRVHCANYKTGYFTKLVGKNGDEKIGATGETLTTDNLVLDDDKDFVAYEPFAAKAASYSRTMKAGTIWATLCLPFAIVQSQETECKFYRLTGIDNDNECITLESCEGAEIPAGTPVLFKMNEGKTSLSLSASNAEIATAPTVAGTNTDVNLVGSFTKIGGKDNQGLADTDYIIGKDKFWLVSELKKDGKGKGVGIKPMRAYIHPATASQARAAMLSIGKGDGTTAIDNLNAISNDANAEYYDANGRRTNGLQKGLNIVKRGSKTYKIMVK